MPCRTAVHPPQDSSCWQQHLRGVVWSEAKALAPVAEVRGHHPRAGRVVQVGRQQLPVLPLSEARCRSAQVTQLLELD